MENSAVESRVIAHRWRVTIYEPTGAPRHRRVGPHQRRWADTVIPLCAASRYFKRAFNRVTGERMNVLHETPSRSVLIRRKLVASPLAVGKARVDPSCLSPLARVHAPASVSFSMLPRAYLVSLATSDARGVSKNDDRRARDGDRERMITSRTSARSTSTWTTAWSVA